MRGRFRSPAIALGQAGFAAVLSGFAPRCGRDGAGRGPDVRLFYGLRSIPMSRDARRRGPEEEPAPARRVVVF